MASAVHHRAGSGRLTSILISLVLLAVPVLLVLALLGFGPVSSHPNAPAPAHPADPYSRLLLALPVVLAACHLTGALFRRFGQPAVIGEIVAGVLLGPSLLGAVWPAAFAWLFPDTVVTAINTLAQLGLVFFMYLIGSEINLDSVRRRRFTVTAVVQANIALPMLTGIALAFALYPAFGGDTGFVPFALFVAVAMSVTAFPVLARILTDRGIAGTPLGAIALSCAAIGDVVAWCLLAMVIAISGGGGAAGVSVTIGLAVLFVALMLFVVRPVLARLLAGMSRRSEAGVLPVLLAGIMLSALATNEIGIHPIFGAFLFGAIAPRTPPATAAGAKMESFTVTLLLPLFFVYTGLHTTVGLLSSGGLWLWCAAVVVVAVATKWGGTTIAARATGLTWPEALSLGALMNCRGLTELVVLNVGLQLKVISPTVFAMLVIMTLLSTAATAPGLAVIGRRFSYSPADAPPATPADTPAAKEGTS